MWDIHYGGVPRSKQSFITIIPVKTSISRLPILWKQRQQQLSSYDTTDRTLVNKMSTYHLNGVAIHNKPIIWIASNC